MPIRFSFLDDFKNLLRAGNESFCGTLDVNALILVLMNSQVDF